MLTGAEGYPCSASRNPRLVPKTGTCYVWIKWIGAHKDYDRIDVAKVEYDD